MSSSTLRLSRAVHRTGAFMTAGCFMIPVRAPSARLRTMKHHALLAVNKNLHPTQLFAPQHFLTTF